MSSRDDPRTSSGSRREEAGAAEDRAQLTFDQRLASTPRAPAPTAPPAAQEPRILAVVELVRAARQTMEARFGDVRVEGEVSGCKRSTNGHVYFTLKDALAQVDCVMYARDAGRMKFRLGDGQRVRCRGRLTIFEGRGRFQLQVASMEPAGAGALALAFEALKQKLAAEGLFASERKRPLPFLPRRIGVVTSRQGAVIRDIVRVVQRRFPVPILLAPTSVQGDGAATSIAAALSAVCRVPDVDVIILARGGGSMEDLWAFNDEALARAIVACPTPTISAVGHETDFTIADFVADVRAPTPSAAAELVVPVKSDLRVELGVLCGRLGRALVGKVAVLRLALERARRRLGSPSRLVDERRQLLDDLLDRAHRACVRQLTTRRKELQAAEGRLLRAHPQRRIADQRRNLGLLERRLAHAALQILARRRRDLDTLSSKLDVLSPLKVLDRGYSVAHGPDGKLLRSPAGLAPGDAVTVTLRDGSLRARVDEVLAQLKRS